MTLKEVRRRIDAIDSQLVPLFCQRMDCSREVAKIKEREQLPIFNAQREEEILNRVAQEAGEYGDAARMLYASIMQASRALQHGALHSGKELRRQIQTAGKPILSEKKPVVACPGVAGSFSHQAAMRLYPGSKAAFYPVFEDVFSAVDRDEADFGVIPVENSSAGSVSDVYDLLLRYRFSIVGAAHLSIRHFLCASENASLKTVKQVYSHPQALSQCSLKIKAHGLKPVNYSNTAAAAEMVAMEKNPALAAICSREAAKEYGLNILEENVQNSSANQTRFVAISKALSIPDDADKISLCFSLNHTTGSLYSVLGRFAMLGLNLTKIESRPIPDRKFEHYFEYFFYLDFIGSVRDNKVLDLICALSDELPGFSFLGNYREAE